MTECNYVYNLYIPVEYSSKSKFDFLKETV